MYVEQTFALIQNDIVVNRCVCSDYETANQLAKNIYGQGAYAIECTRYPTLADGDTVTDGAFYHGETAVEIEPTLKEQVTAVKNENTILTAVNRQLQAKIDYLAMMSGVDVDE